jgi:hypothetical protein
MLDIKDFSIFEDQVSLTLKGFNKNWKLLVVLLSLISPFIAYQVNIRKQAWKRLFL